MTEKQNKILQAALELFAEEGFKATSTSKIAKKAGVSEGLIFRHFGNKEGLLTAIFKEAEQKLHIVFADIIFETNPKKLIEKTISISSIAIKDENTKQFWKLQYKLKWELEEYNEDKMRPLKLALEDAFEKLKYENPSLEAEFLLISLDGLATNFFLRENFDLEKCIGLMKTKYKI